MCEVGEILKKLRNSRNESLRKQAEKLDIGASYLCDISQGNRKMTINVLQRVMKEYKYQCTDEDFVTMSINSFGKDMFDRYKLRSHISDPTKAAKDLIFILSGVIL